MNEFPSKDVLPLKFLYIDENNQCTVKSTSEPLNLFYELYGYEPVSFLYTPYITQVNINNVREKALKHARNPTISQEEKMKRIRNLFDKAESHPQYGRYFVNATPDHNSPYRSKFRSIQIASIPSQYTNGKHLCIAWRKNKNYKRNKTFSEVSYIISAAIGDTLWGREEEKGKKNLTKFTSHFTNAIIFDSDTPQPFKCAVPITVDGMKKKINSSPQMKETLYTQILYACKQHFVLQEENKANKKMHADGVNAVLTFMRRKEVVDLDDEYQQMVKKHLMARCEKIEMFEKVLQDVLTLKKRDDEFLQWRIQNKVEAKPAYLLC